MKNVYIIAALIAGFLAARALVDGNIAIYLIFIMCGFIILVKGGAADTEEDDKHGKSRL